MSLAQQKCEPCQEGGQPLSLHEARELAAQTPKWKLEERSIEREFEFEDFEASIRFVNEVARLAEEEDHHPDIYVRYDKVGLKLSTHKIGGLSKNDFILAAKIDQLL